MLLKIAHKTIKLKKKNITYSLLCWSTTLLRFIQIWRLIVKSQNVGDFAIFFNGFEGVDCSVPTIWNSLHENTL